MTSVPDGSTIGIEQSQSRESIKKAAAFIIFYAVLLSWENIASARKQFT